MPFLPLYIAELGTTDVARDRDVDGPDARRDADRHGDQRAALGPRRRSLRQQGPRHSIADRIHSHQGRDGVRDRAVAAVRAARAARGVCRLRRADDLDGGRIGAARSHGAGHRHGADRPSARPGGRSRDRRPARADRRTGAMRFSLASVFYVVALVAIVVFYKEPREGSAPRKVRGGRAVLAHLFRLPGFLLALVGDLRIADRRSEFWPGVAAVCRASRRAGRLAFRLSPACCFLSARSPRRLVITSPAA